MAAAAADDTSATATSATAAAAANVQKEWSGSLRNMSILKSDRTSGES